MTIKTTDVNDKVNYYAYKSIPHLTILYAKKILTNNKTLAYACFMTLEQTDLQRTEIFKVLSDINRLRIIRVLRHAKHEMTCGEIGEKLNISKSTVSYHFKMLRNVGLTNTRRESQSKYLSLNYQTFNNFLPGFLDSL